MISIRSFVRGAYFSTAIALSTLAIAACPSSLAAQQPPQAEELLGFSRYLPEDVNGYLSLLQIGRVVRSVGESNAWKRLEQVPELQNVLKQWQEARSSKSFPPEAQMALALLEAAGDSELTVAVRPDVSRNVWGLMKLGMLSVGGFAPLQTEPGSPDGLELRKKQAEYRKQWVETVRQFEIPSLVLAARVRDPAKYSFFVQAAVDRAAQAAVVGLGKNVSDEARGKLEQAFTPVVIGRSSLRRFRLRLGDVVPSEKIAVQLGSLPLDEAERASAATAIANLTLDAHLGFVGEYLTLCISSDDAFIRAIVDRYEGRSKQTLAAALTFAKVRDELTSDTIGILYADSTDAHREINDVLLPLLEDVTDPEFLSRIGMPLSSVPKLIRFRTQIEGLLEDAPLAHFSVLQLDRGLKQLSQIEYERDPFPAASSPPAVLAALPADSLAIQAFGYGTLQPMFEPLRQGFRQIEAQITQMEKRFGEGTQAAAEFKEIRTAFQDIYLALDDKVAPSLEGPAALLLGPFVPFAVEGPLGADIPKFSVPTGALVIDSETPELAIARLNDCYKTIAVVYGKLNPRGDPLPVSFEVRQIDGVEHRVLALTAFSVHGLEPNVAMAGDWLVFSTSLDLTKKIRETEAGRRPSITSAPAYQAAAKDLPEAFDELTFIDMEKLLKSTKSTVDDIFAYVDADAEKNQMSERNREQLAVAKRLVGVGFQFASTVRRVYGSVNYQGRKNIQRDWIRIEDLPAN